VHKPTVYLDTTIISAYWYEGGDVACFTRQLKTRQWWELERPHFSVWSSAVSEVEFRAGEFRRQADCLSMVRRLNYLPASRLAQAVYDRLLAEGVVPKTKPRDALQMAMSAAHQLDYLLSWNYAHLANPIAQARLDAICEKLRLRAPLLVSPETIPKKSMGQSIRRRHR
jgi:hypothetical protein